MKPEVKIKARLKAIMNAIGRSILWAIPRLYLTFVSFIFIVFAALGAAADMLFIGLVFFFISAHFAFRALRYKDGQPVIMEGDGTSYRNDEDDSEEDDEEN